MNPTPGSSAANAKLKDVALLGLGAAGLAVGIAASGPVFLAIVATTALQSHLMARYTPSVYQPAVEKGTEELRRRVDDLEREVFDLRRRTTPKRRVRLLSETEDSDRLAHEETEFVSELRE